jgi:hypothetical protein
MADYLPAPDAESPAPFRPQLESRSRLEKPVTCTGPQLRSWAMPQFQDGPVSQSFGAAKLTAPLTPSADGSDG